MATEPNVVTDALFVELDTHRQIRHRNKLHYRLNHWPIWIFVFFIAPGPLTFDLFERGPSTDNRKQFTSLAPQLASCILSKIKSLVASIYYKRRS